MTQSSRPLSQNWINKLPLQFQWEARGGHVKGFFTAKVSLLSSVLAWHHTTLMNDMTLNSKFSFSILMQQFCAFCDFFSGVMIYNILYKLWRVGLWCTFFVTLLKWLSTAVCIRRNFCSDGQFDFPCTHITLLPAKNLLNWIRIKDLRWFRRNKEIIVTLGNNTPVISVTLGY